MQETLFTKFKFRHNMYKLREERDMEPETFAHLVSNILYEKRFGAYMCQPVIAGINKEGTPYLCGMDSIGAMETSNDFMVGGSAPESLTGVCESFWRPNMVRSRSRALHSVHGTEHRNVDGSISFQFLISPQKDTVAEDSPHKFRWPVPPPSCGNVH